MLVELIVLVVGFLVSLLIFGKDFMGQNLSAILCLVPLIALVITSYLYFIVLKVRAIIEPKE